MNSNELLDYLHHPEKLQQPQAEQLARVLEEYPYSGVLQVLYLRALKNQNNYLFPKQLKRAAIAVPDRKTLYYWVEAEVESVAAMHEKPKIEFNLEPKVAAAEVKSAQPPSIPQLEPIKPAVPVPPPISEPAHQPAMPVDSAAIPVAPIPAVPKSQAIAEGDLDLANLPASVRETVLRARRIRQQFGNVFNDAAPSEKHEAPTAPQATVPPAPQPNILQTESEPKAEPEVIAPLPEVTTPPKQPESIVPEPLPEITYIRQPVPLSPKVESSEPNPQEVAHEPIAKTRHSFLEWLSADEDLSEIEELESETTKAEPIEVHLPEEPRTEAETEQPEQSAPKPSTEEVKDLYEAFMEKRPKPRLDFKATDAGTIDAASLGTGDYASYITETLAQIYVKQKLYDRAINAYEILRLKYPEKSGLFAARILEIKRLLND